MFEKITTSFLNSKVMSEAYAAYIDNEVLHYTYLSDSIQIIILCNSEALICCCTH